ncbi:hypothetical protein SLEP1_g44188 [Rubroshorea leprosula]|uniref:PGG domain-containing protein n=1 Tax=Rubroshorea leprosula TaxID=152421 RepID=A0AAV5LFW4_9ROSI|nr:hypothetical protein SLEP1_g44188 [Rubroshorea leprosula]
MAAGNITSNVIVPQVLAESNYEEWSMCMKNYLIAHDLWDVVEESSNVNTADKVAAGWRKKNAAVLHAFQISCAPVIFAHIKGVNSAKDAWGKLAERYELKQKWQLLRKGRSSEELADIIQWFQGTTPDFQGTIPGASDCIDRCTVINMYMSIFSENGWSAVMELIENHPAAKTARFLRKGFPILNIVVLSGNLTRVEQLIERMSKKELETTTDHEGNTALAIAAILASTKIAGCLIRKNRNLVTIPDNNGMIPVVKASYYRYDEMTMFLYLKTPIESLDPANGGYGSLLLHFCILNKMTDIAWDLLDHYPRLAFTKFKVNNQESTPIMTLSAQPSLFRSGSELSILQRWIYSRIKVGRTAAICRNYDVPIEQDDVPIEQDDVKIQVPRKQHGLSAILQKLPGMKHLYEQKLIHKRAEETLHRISSELSKLNARQLVESGAIPAFFQAVQHGIMEFLGAVVVESCLDLLSSADENSRDMFMHAIEYRVEKFFHNEDFSKNRIFLIAYRDKDNNNVLHMAAKLAPDSFLTRISGPALKMQRELQWFKELETLVPECKEFVNQNGETPQQVFSRDHKQLAKEGEEWMKQTAQSYTVVGALIITIMFAAGFTVPGGNNQDTGLPIFLRKRLFMVFILSDAISLFSACTSVLMFLGILTSRYAEEDFLESLPTKLIIGICTLLISITAMMVAFCAAVSTMLRGQWWVIVLLVLFASIPVIVFLLLQSRLLIEILHSTCGSGIFIRKRFFITKLTISIREKMKKFARKNDVE